MYKLVKEPRAWWPVVWNGVSEDGDVVENKFEMRFVLHPEDEFHKIAVQGAHLGVQVSDDLVARVENASTNGEAAVPASQRFADFVVLIASDWRGVGAENGEALPFTPDNLRALMNAPGAFRAVVAAYGRCRQGEKDVRAGN